MTASKIRKEVVAKALRTRVVRVVKIPLEQQQSLQAAGITVVFVNREARQ